MSRRRISMAVALLLPFLAIQPALAEELPPWAKGVPAADRTAAKEAFSRGNADFERARYAAALTAYEEALARWENPQVRYNAALCRMHLDRVLEAYRDIERALAFGEAPFERELFEEAKLHKKLLRAQLASVVVSVRPADALLTINGEAAESGAERLGLPGTLLVVATKDGYDTQTQRIVASVGASERLEIELRRTEVVTISRRYPGWLPWTVGAVGAATLGGAVAFHLRSRSQFADYDDALLAACPSGCLEDEIPGDVRAIEDRASRSRVVATIGYALGVGIAVTGITLAVLNRERAVRQPEVGVVPSRHGIGVVVRSRF